MNEELHNVLKNYQINLEDELYSILNWWLENMCDEQNGGFHGSIDNAGNADDNAPKGIVMYSRILWTFSAVAAHRAEVRYHNMADRAYQAIRDQFLDKNYGGVFWSVDRQGNMLQGKKQIYGLAFAIYALSEYWKITKDPIVLSKAIDLFSHIDLYSRDKSRLGYYDAFDRDWSRIEDFRLSEKDDNAAKTMNTHLHIVEAYANLYEGWKSERLKVRIGELLDLFSHRFIDPITHHLRLFFDEDWKLVSSLVSYGHDIEAAWLLLRCAEIAGDALLEEKFREYALLITEAADEGWDEKYSGLYYEFKSPQDGLIAEKHWWPQAEAMVGYFNAWEISKNEKWLNRSLSSFEFIQKNLKDNKRGEWFWGIDGDGEIMQMEKAGFWKCPYHNSRSCIEVIKRIKKFLSNAD